ncbi:hypothetical protein AXF42_Ash004011 [Apostasia shenzhenica]|uniref:Uncharacterized protein n=1 Tax=Apostasia shenzhenica TaxID=1088818 RepID=A0A2I0AII4_9ASPA|nr:hypothetical protein AXF42_Ash004011 [Apostasia shenzhenica]
MIFGNCGVPPSLFRYRFILIRFKPFSNSSQTGCSGSSPGSDKQLSVAEEAAAREEAYRQVHNLDFKTAAKILFTTPPKRKKFGIDFHLVQLFFTCMPSLAVYLVAQYARYEIRRMEAEAEQKKIQAEELKAKEIESDPNKEGSETELGKVKVRLDALEEAVKEIVDVNKKKVIPSDSSSNQEVPPSDKGSHAIPTDNGKIQNKNTDKIETASSPEG